MADIQISTISANASESNQAGWWHPVDSFQGNEYYALCAVSGTTGYHKCTVVKRDSAGNLTSGDCKLTDGTTATFIDDIGHNQPSIVIDGAGFIHVFTSMHANLLNYFRSTRPGDVTSLVSATWNFPDVEWTWTYPIVSRAPNGDIYAMLRASDRYSTGETLRAAFIYKWDIIALRWDRYAHIAENNNRAVYPDDLRATSTGLSIIFEWSLYAAAAVRHVGDYGKIGTDGFMYNIAGTQFPMPVTQGQLAYKPLQPGENANSGSGYVMGIQSAKFAFNDDETLSFITYRFRDADDPTGDSFTNFRVKVATWSGSAWIEQEIAYVPTTIGNTSAALAATVQSGKKRVYFSVEYTSAGSPAAVIVLAENSGSAWVFSILGTKAPTLLRLGSAPGAGGDVIYVSSPYEGKVSRYFVPTDYTPSVSYTNFNDLLNNLP